MPQSLYKRNLTALQNVKSDPFLHRHSILATSISVGLLLGVFLLDLHSPIDIGIDILYTAVIMLCLWIRHAWLIWLTASLASVFTVLALIYGARTHSGVLPPAIWINRSITILLTWVLAGLVSTWMRSRKAADESHVVIRQLLHTFELAQAFIRTMDGEILFWSRGAELLYGWSPQEAIGQRSHSLLHTQFPERREAIEATLSTDSRWDGELCHRRKSGEAIWVASHWTLETTLPGLRQVVIEVNNDITKTKGVEAALLESQGRFQRLAEANVVGFVVAQFDRILEANDWFLQILGYERQEESSLTWARLLPEDEALKRLTLFQQLSEAGRSQAMDLTWVGKDGRNVPTLCCGVMMQNRFLLVVIDQTERVRLEKQLSQTNRLESLGQLAGGIAHDFNNLLTIIMGQVGLLLDDVLDGDPIKERLQAVQHAADRGAALTHQLLAFSRHQPNTAEELNLDAVLHDSSSILRQLIREDIQMVLRLNAGSDNILATSIEIEQILFNLVVNARDAMPVGGQLFIETDGMFLDSDYAKSHVGLMPGRCVLLSVRDTGTGLPENVKEHLFEPFFTTKEVGKGTGLGLSTVYGIVRKCRGMIFVDSKAGEGTTFKVYFPASGGIKREQGTEFSSQIQKSVGGTILVAEDEPDLRCYIRDLLERSGYTVLLACNGKEALDIVRSHSRNEPISLLLTDMVMPGMGGDELAFHFRGEMPGVPVVRMSGYTDRLPGPADLKDLYIQKPFASSQLLTLINCLVRD